MKKIFLPAFFILLLAGCQLSDLNKKITWPFPTPENFNTGSSDEADYENKTIEEHAAQYDLVVNYPQIILNDKTEEAKLNQELKTKVDTIISSFKGGVGEQVEDLPEELISQLDIDYGLDNLDNQLVSIHFDIYNYYAGAAHGFSYFETFNYDLNKDKKLNLLDVFRADTKYLEKLSEMGNDYFSAQLEEGYFHPEGVEPRNENWQNFTLTNDSLIFYFDDYAVAPYAAGTQELEVFKEDLQDYLLPEYQATAEISDTLDQATKTYEDAEYDFQFDYPANYIFNDTDEIYMFLTENPLLSVSVPSEEFSGTNLSEAQFIVGASEDENIMAKCEEKQAGEEDLGEKIINGRFFRVFQRADSAAGNLYDSMLYRLLDDDVCYEIALLLHSGNIGNYEPGTVLEFDKEEILKKLEEILKTFKINDDNF